MKLPSPAVLWLLTLLPCLIVGYLAWHWRKQSSLSFASLALVRQAMSPGPSIRHHVPAILLLLAVGLALIAVARPMAVVPTPAIARTIILALDTSTSMAAQDVVPSRIDAARSAAKAFIATQPPGVRIGILAFSGYADLMQPRTNDHAALVSTIDDLYLQQGTSIGGGLMAALLTLFPHSGFSGHHDVFGAGRSPVGVDFGQFDRAAIIGRRSADARAPGSHPSAAIILLTDRRNRSGPASLKAAQLAAERGVRVYAIGVGRVGGQAGG